MTGDGLIAFVLAILFWLVIIQLDDVDPQQIRDACYPDHGGVRQVEETTWSQPEAALVVCRDGTVAEVSP